MSDSSIDVACDLFNIRCLQNRIKELEAEILELSNGYKGACHTCEAVGELNVELEKQLSEINEACKVASEHDDMCDIVTYIQKYDIK